MQRSRRGYTFMEMLIVLIIVGALVALLIPAVSAATEAARRCSCMQRLSQLSIAIHNYEMAHSVLPAGTLESKGPILNWPRGYHHSWIVQVLPMIEHGSTQKHVDFEFGVYHARNAPVRRLTIEVLHCPSAGPEDDRTNYAAVCHDREAPIDDDNNGTFFLNSFIRHSQISDGLSHTIFLGEVATERNSMGWMSGTRATLRNTDWSANVAPVASPMFPLDQDGLPYVDAEMEASLMVPEIPANRDGTGSGKRVPSKTLLYVGGFSGSHPGGAAYAMGDGSVRFLSQTVDPVIYQRLGNRSDGRPVDR